MWLHSRVELQVVNMVMLILNDCGASQSELAAKDVYVKSNQKEHATTIYSYPGAIEIQICASNLSIFGIYWRSL